MSINRNIYKLFIKQGFKLEIVVPKYLYFPSGKKYAEPIEIDDPNIHYLELNTSNPRIYFYKGLFKVLENTKPSIIILDNDPVSYLSLILGLWSKKKNVKLFCISCENQSLKIFSSIKRRGLKNLPVIISKRLILFFTKRLVYCVFTINERGSNIFKKEGYNLVIKIPLGFDPSIFFINNTIRNTIRTDLRLCSNIIGYFGRITPEKGIDVLLYALSELKHLDWVLIMDDFHDYKTEYSNILEKLIDKLDLSNRIKFVTPNHHEIANFMNATDIIVVPSISNKYWVEQYGRVAAEAMACGKIVIASNTGALPEIINDFGFLFEEKNYNELSKIIKSYIINKNDSTKIDNYRISKYALDHLSINKQFKIMNYHIKDFLLNA